MRTEFRCKMEPLFSGYYANMLNNRLSLRHFFLRNAAIFTELNLRNKRVLDVGAGFGMKLVCLSLMGIQEGVGIERDSDMMNGFLDLVSLFERLNIKPVKGDIHDHDFGLTAFDAIILENAISHIGDTEALLERLNRILSPTGVLYISDDNNNLFPLSFVSRWKSRKEAESGTEDMLRAARSREVDRTPFRDLRAEMIHEKFPQVDQQTLNMLVKGTRGMTSNQVKEAVGEYVAHGERPRKSAFPYRNPVTGEFAEKGFDPLNLARVLEKSGFKCRILRPPDFYLKSANPGLPKHQQVAASFLLWAMKYAPDRAVPFMYPSFSIVATRL